MGARERLGMCRCRIPYEDEHRFLAGGGVDAETIHNEVLHLPDHITVPQWKVKGARPISPLKRRPERELGQPSVFKQLAAQQAKVGLGHSGLRHAGYRHFTTPTRSVTEYHAEALRNQLAATLSSQYEVPLARKGLEIKEMVKGIVLPERIYKTL